MTMSWARGENALWSEHTKYTVVEMVHETGTMAMLGHHSIFAEKDRPHGEMMVVVCGRPSPSKSRRSPTPPARTAANAAS